MFFQVIILSSATLEFNANPIILRISYNTSQKLRHKHNQNAHSRENNFLPNNSFLLCALMRSQGNRIRHFLKSSVHVDSLFRFLLCFQYVLTKCAYPNRCFLSMCCLISRCFLLNILRIFVKIRIT